MRVESHTESCINKNWTADRGNAKSAAVAQCGGRKNHQKPSLYGLALAKKKTSLVFFILGILIRSITANADFCDVKQDVMLCAVSAGKLSEARLVALKAVQAGCNEHSFAKDYQKRADGLLSSPQYSIQLNNNTSSRVKMPADQENCWTNNSLDPNLWWDQCCSQLLDVSLTDDDTDICVRDDGVRICCDFFVGSSSYLRLPPLREVALRVRAQTDNDDNVTVIYDLEQDGFLRMYDTAGVLWPTAYFLGLCVAAPTFCGVPELYKAIAFGSSKNTLELGAGIGFPSVVLARLVGPNGGVVVATDNMPHALALTASNAWAANASVTTAILDFFEWTDVIRLREEYKDGFSIILGSALQSMFDSTKDADHVLWKVLDALLDHSEYSIVLLAHTTGLLNVPQKGIFRRMQTISGMQFGLKCKYTDKSDFEISILRRASSALHQRQLDSKEEL